MLQRLPTRFTYVGLFMVTLSTLMYEIALTRIFSVTMWYHFAFVAISVALFGLTVGALLVHLLPHRFRESHLDRNLWLFSLLFSVSIVACIAIQLSIKVVPRLTVAGVVSVMATCVVVAVPFIFSGVVVCLCLTRFPTRVNRLYAVDLVGAGLGCVVLVLLFTRLDGPSLVVAVGAFAALGATAFAAGMRSRRSTAVALVVVVLLGGSALVNGQLASNGDAPLRIRWAKEMAEKPPLYERWNAFSRITVDGDTDARGAPLGFLSKETPASLLDVGQLGLVIDNTAGTALTRYSGDPDETDFLRYDLTNLAHNIRRDADVLVIGVGGGRDILSALEFDQRAVTGVEINGNILQAVNHEYGDYTGHLDRDPRVTFVNDEARSYLARNDDQHDIIQMSLIDTWAATSAGAYALSENSLYTTDAWDLFLDRLRPGGVFSVSRWYEIADTPPFETYRTVALAAQVLKDRGVERPRDHILVYKTVAGFLVTGATILVSPEPFSESDLTAIDALTARLDFDPVLTPSFAVDRRFADITDPRGPGRAVAAFDEDISPPTDNRPFFFQMADLDTFMSGRGFDDDFVFRPVLVLAILGLTVLALASVCIALPLVLDRKRARPPRMRPFYTYFAGIGFGFLLIEISQLQRLNVFLGHPTYSLTVVLFTVLVFSGIGSMVTERFVRTDRRMSLIAPLGLLLATIGAFAFLTPTVIDRMASETTPVRIAVSVGLLAPLAIVMGMPFAIGMRAASARDGVPTAYLWGINGATSVCASVLAVVLALFFGISTAFWAGGLAYLVALVSMLAITRPQPSTSTGVEAAVGHGPVPAGVH